MRTMNPIQPQLCGLSYITIDDAIQQVLRLGPSTLLAKLDFKSTFRLLPVHPGDRHLLGMAWRNQVYLDTCLPFGLRSAPKLFTILADFLAGIVQERGVSHCLHYLDDNRPPTYLNLSTQSGYSKISMRRTRGSSGIRKARGLLNFLDISWGDP